MLCSDAVWAQQIHAASPRADGQDLDPPYGLELDIKLICQAKMNWTGNITEDLRSCYVLDEGLVFT